MTDPAIIEAAARALHKDDGDDLWSELGSGDQKYYIDLARCLLTAVTPLIRNAALEDAAQVAASWNRRDIAASIRALKPASPSPSADSA